VIKSIVAVLFVSVVLICAFSLDAAAQTSLSCTTWVSCGPYSFWNTECVPALPQGAFNCVPSPTIGQTCQEVTNQCPPAAAGDETCPTCGKATPTVGGPISLGTGNTYIQQNDVRIPGLSGGLTLVRTWISRWPSTQSAFQVGLFGPNWRSNFEERIFVGNDNYIKYARGDGSFWSFGYTSGGIFGVAAPRNAAATLTQGNTYWTLKFQNGEQRLFSVASGSLVSIVDRNGNTTQLSYDALNRLVTVTDVASRHLNFTYASSSSYIVTGVSSDVGLSLTYAYDSQNRLSRVTNPDLTTVSFAYDAQSRITTVTDSNGKILESHTYDSNSRGLTSSRANGVDAVTVSYPNQ